MLESKFKSDFLADLQEVLPEIDIFQIKDNRRSDPDIIVLAPGGKWAALEFKRSDAADRQPNQEYRIEELDKKFFAAFVYPENAREVFHDLERILAS